MPTAINELLQHGDIQRIATKLGLGKQAVSKALKKGRPGHPAVQEAVRMAHASGALETRALLTENGSNR
jgi:RIO-like serine/threonine protein kinase